MYKKPDKSQPSLLDFNQPLGLRMNPGCQTQAPFDASTLVWFRKRITMDILNEANEYMLEHKDDGGPTPPAPRWN